MLRGHKPHVGVLIDHEDLMDTAPEAATVRALQTHTRRRTALTAAARDRGAAPAGTAAVLVLESLIFAAEAEVRWLDHCEARLLRAATSSNGASR